MVDTSLFGRAWDLAADDSADRFNAMVMRQSRFVFRVAFTVLRNAADAEDAAQETFLKLYRLKGWDTAVDERAFLARAAWRVAISRRRPKPDAPDTEPRWQGRDPEEAAIAADREAWVHRLIDALPEELRLPLALSSIEGLTSVQIGTAMELPEGTVRSRIARARQILRSKIEERYGPR